MILLIEQNAEMGRRIADCGYILVKDRVAEHGPVEELLNSASAKKLYF